MNKIEAASPNPKRKVIVVQTLRHLPNSTPNPHLWYSPLTMPTVAKAVASDLSTFEPAEASYFSSNLTKFDNSLRPWLAAMPPGGAVQVSECSRGDDRAGRRLHAPGGGH